MRHISLFTILVILQLQSCISDKSNKEITVNNKFYRTDLDSLYRKNIKKLESLGLGLSFTHDVKTNKLIKRKYVYNVSYVKDDTLIMLYDNRSNLLIIKTFDNKYTYTFARRSSYKNNYEGDVTVDSLIYIDNYDFRKDSLINGYFRIYNSTQSTGNVIERVYFTSKIVDQNSTITDSSLFLHFPELAPPVDPILSK